MNHHASRFVDDDDVSIFIDDDERQCLGFEIRCNGFLNVYGDLLARLERLIRLHLAPAERDEAALDQPLNLGARVGRHDGGEKPIKAEALAVWSDGDEKLGPVIQGFPGLVGASKQARRSAASYAARLRAVFGAGATARDRYTSMATASGARTIEMNCDVEKMPTVPRSSPRKISMM